MGNRICVVFLLSFVLRLAGQTPHQVLDKVSKKPISYVNIFIIGSGRGAMADEYGHFYLTIIPDDATVKFTSVGYENLYLPAKKLTDTIFLTPQTIQLHSVVLLKKKNKKHIQIGNVNGKNRVIQDFTRGLDAEPYILAKYFPSDSIYRKYPFVKKVLIKTFSEIRPSFLNLEFFTTNDHNAPGRYLFDENIISEVPQGEHILAFDVSKLNIQVPCEGFFIGVQRIKSTYDPLIKGNLNADGKKSFGPGVILFIEPEAHDTWISDKGEWSKLDFQASFAMEVELSD
jgi:hypothetical protein